MLKNINGRFYGYRESTGEWYDPGTFETVDPPVKDSDEPEKRQPTKKIREQRSSRDTETALGY